MHARHVEGRAPHLPTVPRQPSRRRARPRHLPRCGRSRPGHRRRTFSSAPLHLLLLPRMRRYGWDYEPFGTAQPPLNEVVRIQPGVALEARDTPLWEDVVFWHSSADTDTDRVPSHTPGRDRRDDQCWRNPSRTFSRSAYDESPARCWRPSIRLERAHQAPDQGRRAPIANRVRVGPRRWVWEIRDAIRR